MQATLTRHESTSDDEEKETPNKDASSAVDETKERRP
jgi:hypothetical protein